jgi:outer membrane protein
MKVRGFGLELVLGTFAAILAATPASAQEVKIAVVDGRRALISSNEGRAAEQQLKTLVDRKKSQIEPMEAELKRQEEEFETQKYVLSSGAAEDRKLELIKRQRDLERRMREAQDELEIEQRKLMQPMLKKVEAALQQIGKEKEFTVILEKSSPGVLYTAETLDITDLLIQKLNEL